MDVFEKFLNDYRLAIEVGFYWTDPLQIINHVKLELDEVKAELGGTNQRALQEELGDALHACMELIDFCGFDIQETFELASKKFARRFALLKDIIAEEGADNFKTLSREQKLVFWGKVKQKERKLILLETID